MAKSACLEIHETNVGQGDSVLIINRDLTKVSAAIVTAKGAMAVPADPIDYVPYCIANAVPLTGSVVKALLIDGGDDEYGGNVVTYMADYGVLDGTTVWRPDLMVLVSHYHDDHMAGLRSVFKERIDPVKKGDKVKFVERLRPAIVYQSKPNSKGDPKTERFSLFQGDVDAASKAAKNRTTRVLLSPGGVDSATGKPTEISLGTGAGGIPITVYVVASGQSVYDPISGAVAIKSTGKKADQNDRSVVLMLQYGSFRYFMGGDIAGNGGGPGGNFGPNAVDTTAKKFFSQHADVETTLGPALEALFPATSTWASGAPKFVNAGYATVVKANHHGSSSSLDVHLLGTLRPLLLLISSGVKSRFHRHPTQQVIDRASVAATASWGLHATKKVKADAVTVPNSIKKIYVTEVGQKVKNKAFGLDLRGAPIMGDILVRPVDETVTAIHAATAPGAVLTVQVSGSGVTSDMTDPNTTLLPTVPQNTAGAIYRVGPYLHSDTH